MRPARFHWTAAVGSVAVVCATLTAWALVLVAGVICGIAGGLALLGLFNAVLR